MSFLDDLKEEVIDSFAEVQSEIVEETYRVIESTTEFEGFEGQDIIDTGRFRDETIVLSEATRLLIYWTAKDPSTGFYYPTALIYGFFAYGGKKWIPGREYHTRAVKNKSPVQSLVDKLRAKGINARVIADNTSLL